MERKGSQMLCAFVDIFYQVLYFHQIHLIGKSLGEGNILKRFSCIYMVELFVTDIFYICVINCLYIVSYRHT